MLLTEHHANTKFALRASEVICDSEVHVVSEVSPKGRSKSCIATRANITRVKSVIMYIIMMKYFALSAIFSII